MTNKFCKDCAHVKRDFTLLFSKYFYRCNHSINANPVTGRTNTSCYMTRLDDKKCGPDGKYWEPILTDINEIINAIKWPNK